MIRMPLKMRYFYSEFEQCYKEANSHRKLTIAEYEALEKSEQRAALDGVFMGIICFVIILIGVMLI